MPWDQVPYAEGLTRCEVPGGTIYRYSSGHITFAPEPKAAAPKPENHGGAYQEWLNTEPKYMFRYEHRRPYQQAWEIDRKQGPDVPREPTEAMLDAARQWWKDTYATQLGYTQAMGVWQTMFEAASPKGVTERQNKPPVQQQTGVNREG